MATENYRKSSAEEKSAVTMIEKKSFKRRPILGLITEWGQEI